jgi:hypothetical protein
MIFRFYYSHVTVGAFSEIFLLHLSTLATKAVMKYLIPTSIALTYHWDWQRMPRTIYSGVKVDSSLFRSVFEKCSPSDQYWNY